MTLEQLKRLIKEVYIRKNKLQKNKIKKNKLQKNKTRKPKKLKEEKDIWEKEHVLKPEYKFVYHVTPRSNLSNIRKRGLVPQNNDDTDNYVWFFVNYNDALRAANQWGYSWGNIPMIILTIPVDGIIFIPCPHDEDSNREVATEQRIPLEKISYIQFIKPPIYKLRKKYKDEEQDKEPLPLPESKKTYLKKEDNPEK